MESHLASESFNGGLALLSEFKQEPYDFEFYTNGNHDASPSESTELRIKLEDTSESATIKEEVDDLYVKLEPVITQEVDIKTEIPDSIGPSATESIRHIHSPLCGKNCQKKPSTEHKCDMCGYTTRSKSHLMAHMTNHTGERPFKCGVCDAGFRFKYDLQNHLVVHTGEKPHQCDLCEYKSTQKSYLLRHMKKHSGEKRFKCELCDYRSADSGAVKKHQVLHSGRKDFKCDLCDYRFALKTSLNKHLKVHAKKKNFKCDICNQKFGLESALQIHIKSHVW